MTLPAPSPPESSTTPAPPRTGTYLVLLLACLGVAEYVDAFATAFRFAMTTYVRQEFDVPLPRMLQLLSWVYVGSLLGFVPRMLADVVGRRLMLFVVSASLCIVQWAIGSARTPGEYAALLTVLAVFYKADIWTVMVTEEAPPARRGLFATLPVLIGGTGGITVGLLIARMGDAPDGWRTVARFPIYCLIALVPLTLALRETRSFALQRAARGRTTVGSLLRAPFRDGYARPLVLLTALKIVYLGGATATLALVGTEYLRTVHGLDQVRVGRLIQAQTLAMMLAAVAAGAASDRIGRVRLGRGAAIGYAVALAGLALAPVGSPLVSACYVLQAFFDACVICALRLMSIETFPRAFRATASAWTDAVPTAAAIGTSWTLAHLTSLGVSLSSIILAMAAAALALAPVLGLLRETRRTDLVEF